jgi:undecaprenyl-diphosphatase
LDVGRSSFSHGGFIQLSLFNAILLGTIQGLTEFLPVSSSGHLVIFHSLPGFKLQDSGLFFDVCLHFGTLVAVIAVFYREILSILKTLARLPSLGRQAGGMKPLFDTNEDVRISVLIVAGTIPTALLGFLFNGVADRLFSNLPLVGVMLLVTGTLLWITRGLDTSGRRVSGMVMKDAIILGVVQGLAILPGISRSGSTISAALLIGIDRETAGRFSFLLCIPAIVGAMLLKLKSGALDNSDVSATIFVSGTLAAAFVGFLALIFLLRLIKHGKFYLFSPYCWAVGTLALIFSSL